jgi:hypothetical protein
VRRPIGTTVAIMAIAPALAGAYPALAKSAEPVPPRSGTILIRVITEWIGQNGGVERRVEEAIRPPVRITRLSPGEAFSLETYERRVHVVPGRYQLVLETQQGSSNESRKVTVRKGRITEATFTRTEVRETPLHSQ